MTQDMEFLKISHVLLAPVAITVLEVIVFNVLKENIHLLWQVCAVVAVQSQLLQLNKTDALCAMVEATVTQHPLLALCARQGDSRLVMQLIANRVHLGGIPFKVFQLVSVVLLEDQQFFMHRVSARKVQFWVMSFCIQCSAGTYSINSASSKCLQLGQPLFLELGAWKNANAQREVMGMFLKIEFADYV
jgi:hypothetical protein